MMAALGILGLAALLIALRQPIVTVLAAVTIILYTVWQDGNPVYVAYDIWRAVNNEAFIAIPLFMLAGAIMSKGSIAERLIDFIKALTKPIPGGLAVAVVLACIGFGSVSGSSAATLMAVGGIMYPALLKAGYSKKFAIGLVCASATLGVIVPPSILMILLGIVGSAPGRPMSIQDLFVGGLAPALLLTVLLAGYAMITHAHLRGGWWSLAEIGRTFVRAIFALLVPAAILGGIYSGAFTATEAAAVAVLIAVIVELAVHRDMSVTGLRDVVIDTSRLLGSLFPLIALAVSVNIFLTWEGVPQAMARELGAMIHSKTEFILYSNVLLLILGALLDEGSAVLIFAPLLLPLAEHEGMHPVHFGVMMIVNLQIGYLAPPVGLNLMIAAAAFRESFWDVCKAVLPFIVILLIGVAIVAAFPQLTIWHICAETPNIAPCQ
jgi:C4-dicarboxylate transporter, DctM subunit